MAVIKGWTMTPKSLTEEGNKFKEIFLDKMLKEGHISQQQVDVMNEYSIVIAEKSFFGKFWDKILWKNDENAVNIVVVKVIN